MDLDRPRKVPYTHEARQQSEAAYRGLSGAFASDAGKLTQWRAFATKNRLNAIALVELVRALRAEFQRLKIA